MQFYCPEIVDPYIYMYVLLKINCLLDCNWQYLSQSVEILNLYKKKFGRGRNSGIDSEMSPKVLNLEFLFPYHA